MKYKVLKFLSVGLVMTVLAGCGAEIEDAGGDNVVSTESSIADSSTEIEQNPVENTEKDSETAEDVPKEAEPTYTEKEEVFVIDNQKFKTVPDEEKIDMEALPHADVNGEYKLVIVKEVDIYYENKQCAGYAKVGARPSIVAGDDEWYLLVFKDGNYLLKKDELLDSMMVASEYDNQNQTANNETSSDSSEPTENMRDEGSEVERPEITYTVTDMSKTMYAKQSVNVRRGPSSDFERLGGLSTNQEVTVTGQADTGWYRIAFNGGEAFVSNSYLSDSKVEVSTTPNTGNTVPDSGSQVEVPSQPENPEPPSTPSTTYTEAEVISIVRSTLEGAGIQWYPDSDEYQQYLQHPELYSGLEIGPDGGMGWGISEIPMNDPQTAANSLLEGAQWSGYTYYYIENLGVSNGCVTLKVYGG